MLEVSRSASSHAQQWYATLFSVTGPTVRSSGQPSGRSVSLNSSIMAGGSGLNRGPICQSVSLQPAVCGPLFVPATRLVGEINTVASLQERVRELSK